MDNNDEQKRIALQELFRNRLKNSSLERSANYVSKLVPVEEPVREEVPTITKEELDKKVIEFMTTVSKKMWVLSSSQKHNLNLFIS